MKRRILALLLCLCMAATLLPTAALAADGDEETGETGGFPLLYNIVLRVENDDFWEYPELDTSYGKYEGPEYTFPCLDGKTGRLWVGLRDNADATITVAQDDKKVDPAKESETSNGGYYPVSLDKGKTITVDVMPTDGGKTETYTVKLDDFDAGLNGFEILGADGTGEPVTTFTPAFSKDRLDYSVKAPTNSNTIRIRVTPPTGGEVWPTVDGSTWNSIGGEGNENIFDIPLRYTFGGVEDGSEGEEVRGFTLRSVRNGVMKYYNFDIVRAGDQVTDNLFKEASGDYPVYDGKPHTDLVTASSKLDKSKLKITYDKMDTETIKEELPAVTDAGGYYVYVSYEGDGVYEKTENRRLCYSGGEYPVTVWVKQAPATVQGKLEEPVSIGYHKYYYEIDLPGIKVVDSSGKELPGKWSLDFYEVGHGPDDATVTSSDDPDYDDTYFKSVDPQVGQTYDVYAYYRFDESLNRNYALDSKDERIKFKATISKTEITEADVGAVWYAEESYLYAGQYGAFPNLRETTLGRIVGNHETSDGTWIENYTISYGFVDKDGKAMTEADGVKFHENGNVQSGPTNAGTYKICAKIVLDESVKDQFQFDNGTDTLILEKEYTIQPLEVSAKVWIDTRLDQNNNIKVLYPRSDVEVNGFYNSNAYTLTFKKGDTVAELDETNKSYQLNDGESGTFTYTIELTDKTNYKFTSDSVTTATVKTGAAVVTPVASTGASVIHAYSGTNSGEPEEFSGTVSLQGVAAGKDVSCIVTRVYIERTDGKEDTDEDNDRIPGGTYTAWLSLALTGADAGDYVLGSSGIEVPATVVKRSLADSKVYIQLARESETDSRYAYTGSPVTPAVQTVRIDGVWTGSTEKGVDLNNFTVSYRNNTLPSAAYGTEGESVLAKVIITAKDDSYFTGSAFDTFVIASPEGTNHAYSSLVSLKGGETKDITLYMDSEPTVKIDDSAVASAEAKRVTDRDVKLTITAKASGQAIVMLESRGSEGTTEYYVYGVTVADETAAPGHVHAWASAWSSDANSHWHNCTASGCDVTANSSKDGYGAHVYDNDADATCNTCGYTRAISSDNSGSGSSDSSSSGSGSGTSSSTTNNPDGSTTTTTENRVTGTVTETTKSPDGSQTVVETQKDGTVTTTETDKDGNKTQTVEKTDGSSVTTVQQKDGTTASVNTDTSGKVEAEVSLPQAVVAAAQESGKALALPIPEVKATRSTDSAPAVTVKTNSSEAVKVEIPTANVTPGTVAVLVKADGTEEIIKSSVPTADGVAVSLTDGATVKLVDNSRDFADVSDAHWASGAVDFASSRELFAGTSETDFSPEQSMTRAMLMTVLARYDGKDTSGGATWYEKGMEWSVANGISDGSNPNSAITREQLAVMLYRYSGSPAAGNSLDGFSDTNEISDYAQAAMRWAVEKGIINGFGNGMLGPKGQATRAQVAQMLMNFIGM